MRLASVETVFPSDLPDQLPVHRLQSSSQSASFLKLAIMLPSAIALLLPFLLVAERLASDELFRASVNARPGAALQLFIGLAFWTLLFAWPLKRLAQSFASTRVVKISHDRVIATDSGLFRQTQWEAALSEFTGIAHNVRTSLSGVRHELVLVHPRRSQSVLLAIAPRFSQTDIDHVCALLVCPEISPKELYNLRFPAINWRAAPVAVPAAAFSA